jgi:hypothetical protein
LDAVRRGLSPGSWTVVGVLSARSRRVVDEGREQSDLDGAAEDVVVPLADRAGDETIPSAMFAIRLTRGRRMSAQNTIRLGMTT